mgnify:CR=1 FL=1|jgi:hypothetical protein
MAKETRPKGTGSNDVSDPAGSEAKADSGQVGSGGSGHTEGTERTGSGKPSPVFGIDVWTNERGEKCIGNECFAIAVQPGSDDVTIRVDRNKCGVDMEDMVNDMLQGIGRGGRTVYESTSRVKPELSGREESQP